MVPREYSNECIVSRETHYQADPELASGPQARQGKLDIGRVVWTRTPLVDAVGQDKVAAYADGVGPIELNPEDLKPF